MPRAGRRVRRGSLHFAVRAWLPILVAAWTLLVYVMINVGLFEVLPASLNIYLAQPVFWSGLALLGLFVWRYGLAERPPLDKSLVIMAALLGLGHASLLVIAGLMAGFGHSPYGHRPLMFLGNLVYAGAMLVGVEMSRACILSALGRRNAAMALLLTATFFSLIGIPFSRLTSIPDGPTLLRVSGETFLPTFSENLLASVLALLGGPLPAIAYRGLLQVFEWSSPILPNLHWTLAAFLGTMVPIVGLLVVRSQIAAEPAGRAAARKAEAQSSTAWIAVGAVAVAVLWFNSGLFGVRPTLISGMSMSPNLKAGDIVLVRELQPEAIEAGDVIRFQREGVYIVHRVLEVRESRGEIQFITRGDNNNVDDAPVPASIVAGKVVAVIPKVGWAAIGLRRVIEWIR